MARDVRLAVELVEDVRDILRRDANAGVDNADFDKALHVGRRLQQIDRDGDRAAVGRVFDRVADHVLEDLIHPLRIGVERSQFRRNGLHLEIQDALFQVGAQVLQDNLQNVRQRHELKVQLQRLRVDLRHGDHVVHRGQQAARAGRQARNRHVHLLAGAWRPARG